jgi:hypothetical protein
LINMAEALPARVRARLEQLLGSDVFVGVPLNERDAGEVVAHLDGAAAEASAQLLGGSHPKLLARRSAKRGKSGASRAPGRR